MLVNGDLRKYSQSRVPWHGMAFFQGSRELSSINRDHFFQKIFRGTRDTRTQCTENENWKWT